MERLTKRLPGGTYTFEVGNSWDCIQKLGTYEDAEEQGLLLRLPCKMNDEAWAIRHYRGVVYAQKGFVNEMFFTKDMRLMIVVKNIARGEFGKTVFLTKEEAEQALKQMGE